MSSPRTVPDESFFQAISHSLQGFDPSQSQENLRLLSGMRPLSARPPSADMSRFLLRSPSRNYPDLAALTIATTRAQTNITSLLDFVTVVQNHGIPLVRSQAEVDQWARQLEDIAAQVEQIATLLKPPAPDGDTVTECVLS